VGHVDDDQGDEEPRPSSRTQATTRGGTRVVPPSGSTPSRTGRQRDDGHREPASPSTRDRANLSSAGGAASTLAGSWSGRIVVALPPGRVDVLPIAVAARGTLVIEPMLRSPTTGTPQPPKLGLDLVPHDGTPPWLHRVSARRVPMAPCLGLGPVPAGLALVIEFALAGRTPSPPQPRPHRPDPVQHAHPPGCCDCRVRQAAWQSPI
jgi:hypothetical protein